MKITATGAKASGELRFHGVEAAGVTIYSDWFAIPPNFPLNVAIAASAVFSNAAGFFTMQFRFAEGGAIFDHPDITNITGATTTAVGNIGYPAQAIRFKFAYADLTAQAMIPGFQTISVTPAPTPAPPPPPPPAPPSITDNLQGFAQNTLLWSLTTADSAGTVLNWNGGSKAVRGVSGLNGMGGNSNSPASLIDFVLQGDLTLGPWMPRMGVRFVAPTGAFTWAVFIGSYVTRGSASLGAYDIWNNGTGMYAVAMFYDNTTGQTDLRWIENAARAGAPTWTWPVATLAYGAVAHVLANDPAFGGSSLGGTEFQMNFGRSYVELDAVQYNLGSVTRAPQPGAYTMLGFASNGFAASQGYAKDFTVAYEAGP